MQQFQQAATREMPDLSIYTGYHGLPPLVGMHTMQEAISLGFSVEDAVTRLKRLHWALRRLHGILVSRITSMPIYELKMAFSLHALYASEHVATLAERVREMRQPPLGLDVCPNPSLDLYFDEIQCAPTTAALVLGLYEYAVPAIVSAMAHLESSTNKLFDHATYRCIRHALIEFHEVQAYGATAVRCLVSEADREELSGWTAVLDEQLRDAGALDGTSDLRPFRESRHFSTEPYRYDPVPRRDERFKDPYNMGVNAEAMLFDPSIPALPKTLMLYFKRMREIDVPEMMSSILSETTGKPWEYYREMTRQLWDEARHAMMGETGFASLEIDWSEIPFNYTWSLGLNTLLSRKERHAVLYTIEQGLMPKKTGKEHEWEIAVLSQSQLAARIQDYDWADEILHAKIGRKWILPEIGSQNETLEYGNAAWSRILVDWNRWKDEGLTEHRNWWPEIYLRACRHWGVEPDPKLLAYDTNYETTRADLKSVTA
jgi:hypothetical protein